MRHFIKKIAEKYCKNKLLCITIRPVWRCYTRYISRRQVHNFHKYGLELLSRFTIACEKASVENWLEFGTLLGAYRDGDFIAHDFDIDVGVFYRDKDRLQQVLESAGFKLVREFICGDNGIDGFEQTYSFKSVWIDIFFFHKRNESLMYCNSFSPIIGEVAFEGLSEVKEITVPYGGFKIIDFKGIDVRVPVDAEAHLKAHYGDNFMVPDRNFNYRKDATNIKYFSRSERLAVFKEY